MRTHSSVFTAGESKWKSQADVFERVEKFHADVGDVAATYSEYRLEKEEAGKRLKSAGRVTEIFVRRDGKWVKPGWHTDGEK